MRDLAKKRWAGQGSKLALLRQARGLTQDELARQVGLCRKEISRIESGKVRPRWYVWPRLAKALGTTAGEISKKGGGA